MFFAKFSGERFYLQCLFGQLLHKLEWDQNFKIKEISETKKYIKEYLQFGSSFNILKTEFSPISSAQSSSK